MEMLLGILQGLGIFLVFPLIVALSVAGVFILTDRRARRAKRARITARTEVGEPTTAPAVEKARGLAHEPTSV